MSERTVDVGRGITLAYDQLGDAGGVPLLLVQGLGLQLHSWPDGFCSLLTDRGFRLTRFDNRDVGQSTHAPFPAPRPVAMLRKRWDPRQYDLRDMAADSAGLLGALGISSAHVVGVSMGGMIGQMIAADHPARVRSLTSIMSTTGARRIGRPALSTWRLMTARPARTRAEFSDRAVRMFMHIGSAGFPFDEDFVRRIAEVSWDRDPHPAAGTARQLAAIMKSGNRSRQLRLITAPTLVIHGDRDLMINPSGGAATAAAIPGATLRTISGLGHDLPRGAWNELADLITEHAHRADSRSSDAA